MRNPDMKTNAELRRMGERHTLGIALINVAPVAARIVASSSPVGALLGGGKILVESALEWNYHEENPDKYKRVKQIAAVAGSAARTAAPFVVLALVNPFAAVGTAIGMYAYETIRHNTRLSKEHKSPQDKANNLIPSVQIYGFREGVRRWQNSRRDASNRPVQVAQISGAVGDTQARRV